MYGFRVYMLLEDKSQLTRPKGEKSAQQLIANENFNKPEKAEKQRQRKVCASQKSQELCDEGRVVA